MTSKKQNISSSQLYKEHFQVDHMLGHKIYLSETQKALLMKSMNVKEEYIQVTILSKKCRRESLPNSFYEANLGIFYSDTQIRQKCHKQRDL